jgi:hypothetical protein
MDKLTAKRLQDKIDRAMTEMAYPNTAPQSKVPSKSMRITSPAKTERRS